MSHTLNSLITPETMSEHRARWFVWVGSGTDREKIPHTSTMRGRWPGHDVTCSCGWDSKTGGATRKSVEDDLFAHRFSAQCAKEAA